MRRILIPLVILSLMLFTLTPALADIDGPSLELTVKNRGETSATISVSRNGERETKNTITKKVRAGGDVTFSRKETAHDIGGYSPHGWDVYIIIPGGDTFHEFVMLEGRSKCVVQQGVEVQIESCDNCCFIMTTRPKKQ